jgi:iron complex outermembrane receptor protein
MVQAIFSIGESKYDAKSNYTYLVWGLLAKRKGRKMVTREDLPIRVAMLLLTCLIVFGSGPHSFAQQQKQNNNEPEDLFDMSIEELMNLEITTASKKKEKLFDAPATAYVITSEDIRRSEATSIPDALWMVPGLQVARMNANKWAITSRDFNGEFANKMLVIIDGRSIYTPHFDGVCWDTHDVMLEDVERIEVIRGPGGTLWGANAVNSIINIITKDAKDTQGGLLSGGGGTEEQGFGAARYGDKIDENTYDKDRLNKGANN